MRLPGGRATNVALLGMLWLAPAASAATPTWLTPAYWRLSFDSPIRTVLTADLDADGWSEIGVETADGRLSWLDLQGRVLWQAELGGSGPFLTLVVDLDGDGRPELVVATTGLIERRGDSGQVLALDHAGQILWRRRYRGRPESLDVRFDSAPDARVTLLAMMDQLRAISATGRELWASNFFGWPNRETTRLAKAPDGSLLVAASRPIEVRSFDADGRFRWTTELDPSPFHILADVVASRDGIFVSFGTYPSEARLCKLSLQGHLLWCHAVTGSDSARPYKIRVWKRSGSETDQLLLRGDDLRAFDLDGVPLWRVDRGLPVELAIGNFEAQHDGVEEIALVVDRWRETPATTEIVVLDGEGVELDSTLLDGPTQTTWVAREGVEPQVVISTPHRVARLDRHGLSSSQHPSLGELKVVSDLNGDGRDEALFADRKVLRLTAFPTPGSPSTPTRIWEQDGLQTAHSDSHHASVDGWFLYAVGARLPGAPPHLAGRVGLLSPMGMRRWQVDVDRYVTGAALLQRSAGEAPTAFVTSTEHYPDLPRSYSGLKQRGELTAYGATGAARWLRSLDGVPTCLELWRSPPSAPILVVATFQVDEGEAVPRDRLQAFTTEGDPLWSAKLTGSITDVAADGDTLAAVVVGRQGESRLYSFDRRGRRRWSVDSFQYRMSPVAVGDVDGDGHGEIVAGSVCYDRCGRAAWERQLGGGAAYVALRDLTGDGKKEVVIAVEGYASNYVEVLDGRGTTLDLRRLENRPTAFAVASISDGVAPRFLVATVDATSPGRVRSLPFGGAGVAWSLPLHSEVTFLAPWARPGSGDGILAANDAGGVVLVDRAHRPPPPSRLPHPRRTPGRLPGDRVSRRSGRGSDPATAAGRQRPLAYAR